MQAHTDTRTYNNAHAHALEINRYMMMIPVKRHKYHKTRTSIIKKVKFISIYDQTIKTSVVWNVDIVPWTSLSEKYQVMHFDDIVSIWNIF